MAQPITSDPKVTIQSQGLPQKYVIPAVQELVEGVISKKQVKEVLPDISYPSLLFKLHGAAITPPHKLFQLGPNSSTCASLEFQMYDAICCATGSLYPQVKDKDSQLRYYCVPKADVWHDLNGKNGKTAKLGKHPPLMTVKASPLTSSGSTPKDEFQKTNMHESTDNPLPKSPLTIASSGSDNPPKALYSIFNHSSTASPGSSTHSPPLSTQAAKGTTLASLGKMRPALSYAKGTASSYAHDAAAPSGTSPQTAAPVPSPATTQDKPASVSQPTVTRAPASMTPTWENPFKTPHMILLPTSKTLVL